MSKNLNIIKKIKKGCKKKLVKDIKTFLKKKKKKINNMVLSSKNQQYGPTIWPV